jgi:hypothetical protein
MNPFVILPLLVLVSCQDNIRSRSLIDNSVAVPNANNIATPNAPVATATNTLHSRCQSAYRCFYANMPVYIQNADALEAYVGDKIGVSNYTDAGLCAPTSAAMLLTAVLKERNWQTSLNNSFLESVDTRPWYETVYEIGVEASTDFRNGGTSLYSIYYAFDYYFQSTVAHKGLYLTLQSSWPQNDYVSNQDIINLIKSKKSGFFTVVDALQKNETTVNGIKKIWYQNAANVHAVVIKGFDGDRMHIQDPWGMDHFARLEHESFALSPQGSVQVNGVFTDFSSNAGHFMGRFGHSRKLKLISLVALSLD